MNAVRRFGLVALAVAAAAGGFLLARQTTSGPQPLAGTFLAERRPLPEFALTDDDGQPFGRAQLLGKWTLFFAGFTHCPDVCPNALAQLKVIDGKLAAAGRRAQVVFVSVDPERDPPATLKPYVDYFKPEFVGVTGARGEIDKLCAGLGLFYAKVDGATPQDYTMDHSAAFVLVDPQAQVTAYFVPPVQASPVVADIVAAMARAS